MRTDTICHSETGHRLGSYSAKHGIGPGSRSPLISSVVFLLALGGVIQVTRAEAPLLAQGGQALYTITTPAGASRAEQLAAEKLKWYLDRIAGAQFKIASTSSSPHEILVGRSTQLPDPESFSIDVGDARVLLSGADDRGVFYAVYQFLEELGCRWTAPAFRFYGGDSETVPQISELRFTSRLPITSKPVLKLRKLYVEEGHTHTTQNLQQLIDWMPKLRFNTLVVPTNYQGRDRVRWDNWRKALTLELQWRGITIEVGGHGYQNFISAADDGNRLFIHHPEWFGSDDSGQRTRQVNRVFCTSNKDAVTYMQRRVIDYLRDRPEIQIFDLWPPDGAAWCTCPECRKLGNPSQRHALLVAQTSDAVHKVFPNVRLECIAYASYVEPPETISFDRSVLVDFCPIAQSFEFQINDPRSPVNARYAAAVQNWSRRFDGDVSIYSYYRKYAWNSLPIIIPHYMQKDLQFYRSIGVHGVSSYAEPGDWFTYELNHYLLGHLAWDPDANVEALIQQFCKARYGPAAGEAARIFATLEEITRGACSIPATQLKAASDYDQSLTRIADCRKSIKELEGTYAGASALQGQLRRLDLSLQYAEQDIALQRMTASKLSASERRSKVDALAEFLRAHAGDGVFAMHHRLEPGSLLINYGLADRRTRRALRNRRSVPAQPAGAASQPGAVRGKS